MSISPSAIPFYEIASGATVCFTVINGKQYLSIRDLIMHMCGKDNKRASEVWERLGCYEKAELSDHCMNFQFPGAGQSKQPVITFPGAIKLSMFLPGIILRFGSEVCALIARFLH